MSLIGLVMGETVLELDELLRFAVENDASDLHVKVGSPPFLRVDGRLEPAPFDTVTAADTERIASAIVPEELDRAHEADFAHSVAGLGRFRVSMFRQRGSVGLVLRRVTPGIPALEELGLPPVAQDFAESPNGLVLVVGPARSGKTTTLAAMVDHVNASQRKHIVTIEDPIEILHRDQQSIVNQREVGTDTETYATAVRRAMRHDPDVILIGEIGDAETARAALAAASAGQLVLASMATLTSSATVKALVEYFPAHLEHHARTMLAMSLRGIVSQRLLSRSDGSGRALAAEVLVATPPVIDAVSHGDEMQAFPMVIAEGEYWGMQSLDESLLALFEQGWVAKRDVIANAHDPSDIRIALERIGAGPVGGAPFGADDGTESPPLLSERRTADQAG